MDGQNQKSKTKLNQAAVATAADFPSLNKQLRHGPNKSANEKWFAAERQMFEKNAKKSLNQNIDNFCLSTSPGTPLTVVTLQL